MSFWWFAPAAIFLVVSERAWVRALCGVSLAVGLAAAAWRAYRYSDVVHAAVPAGLAAGFLLLGWEVRRWRRRWP